MKSLTKNILLSICLVLVSLSLVDSLKVKMQDGAEAIKVRENWLKLSAEYAKQKKEALDKQGTECGPLEKTIGELASKEQELGKKFDETPFQSKDKFDIWREYTKASDATRAARKSWRTCFTKYSNEWKAICEKDNQEFKKYMNKVFEAFRAVIQELVTKKNAQLEAKRNKLAKQSEADNARAEQIKKENESILATQRKSY
jgi:hypothetical protein